MSKGYIIIAQDSGENDYLRMAYALALSIKTTQATVNQIAVCVTEPRKIPDKYKGVFDYVIQIPWTDSARDHDWKIQNKWKYYYMTPFDETVMLDADMIFTSDVSYWWEHLEKHDMWFTTNVHNYKNEIITSDYYRKTFTANALPNVYTAFTYFKKSKFAEDVFAMADVLFKNWQKFFYTYLDETRPGYLSGDVAYALIVKILGIENECTFDNVTSMPTFVHMKSNALNVKTSRMKEDWINHIPCYFTEDGVLKVNNFRQTLPFHYHCKEWLTNEVLLTLEERYATHCGNK